MGSPRAGKGVIELVVHAAVAVMFLAAGLYGLRVYIRCKQFIPRVGNTTEDER